MTVALVPAEVPTDAVTLGVVHGDTPKALILGATAVANELAALIEQQRLYSLINNKKFVRCEGWTTCAALMGFLPREASMERKEDGSYEASAELVRIADGKILTRASAECSMDEPTWSKRASYARRSMAATRATSKVCRLAFSWVMTLAGFEATPFEEIPEEERKSAPKTPELHQDAPQAAKPVTPPSDSPVWPFGTYKGKKLSELDSDALIAQKAWAQKKDPVKFAQLIEQVNDELAGRQGE